MKKYYFVELVYFCVEKYKMLHNSAFELLKNYNPYIVGENIIDLNIINNENDSNIKNILESFLKENKIFECLIIFEEGN